MLPAAFLDHADDLLAGNGSGLVEHRLQQIVGLCYLTLSSGDFINSGMRVYPDAAEKKDHGFIEPLCVVERFSYRVPVLARASQEDIVGRIQPGIQGCGMGSENITHAEGLLV